MDSILKLKRSCYPKFATQNIFKTTVSKIPHLNFWTGEKDDMN